MAIRALLAVIFALGCALAIYFLAQPAFAHMKDRPDLDGWFMQLKSRSHGLCCDYSEATAIADVDWRTTDTDKCIKFEDGDKGQYCVRLDDKWFLVPDAALVDDPNKFGQSMVWPVWYGDAEDPHRRLFIRCFMPGAGI